MTRRAQPPVRTDVDLVGAHPTMDDFNWLAKRQVGNAVALAAERHARGSLIDIGCGEKPYQRVFAPFVTDHVGVEHPDSPHATRSAEVIGSAYEIPLADDTFQTALLSEVLEHLEQPDRALAEAYRLLAPGGRLILTSPFMWVLHEPPRDFFRYSPFGLRWLLERAGFTEIEVTPVAGQWSTVALMTSYALKRSQLRWRIGDPARHMARLAQHLGSRLDRRNFRPEMSWDHLAVAMKPSLPEG